MPEDLGDGGIHVASVRDIIIFAVLALGTCLEELITQTASVHAACVVAHFFSKGTCEGANNCVFGQTEFPHSQFQVAADHGSVPHQD